MMETALNILALSLLLFGLFMSLMNWRIWLTNLFGKSGFHSFLPFMGAIPLAVAAYIYYGSLSFSLLCLIVFIDASCLALILSLPYVIIYRLFSK